MYLQYIHVYTCTYICDCSFHSKQALADSKSKVHRLESELDDARKSAHAALESQAASPHSILEQECGNQAPDPEQRGLSIDSLNKCSSHCPVSPDQEEEGLDTEDPTPLPELTTSVAGCGNQVKLFSCWW